MRMDPKTRFVLEVLTRLRGQSMSTVVERAIAEIAESAAVEKDYNGNAIKTWRDFWHVSDGVRWLKMASEPNLYPTFEDEYKVSFARTHWPFFYNSAKRDSYKDWCIEILWPKIDEYVDLWTRTKSSDYFAAGRAMRKAISDAGVAAPDWPIKTGAVDATKTQTEKGKASTDLDDEIPF